MSPMSGLDNNVTPDDRVTSPCSCLRVRGRRRCPEFTPVIMAAGCGSQMFQLSEDTPKCMIPLANTPMIWFSVDFLLRNGFEEIFIVVRRGDKDQIDQFLTGEIRKNNDIEVVIEYVCIDDDVDSGTADSLRKVAPHTKSDLLVMSSDLITNACLHSLATVHRGNGAVLTALTSRRYTAPNDKKSRHKKDDRDFIGMDPRDGRILFISSEKDIEGEVSVKRNQLSGLPHMRMYSNLVDCHLYLVSRTALDILDAHPDVSMIKCELLPLLVRKQIKQIVNSDSVFDSRIYSIREGGGEEDLDKYFNILDEKDAVGCYALQTDQFTLRMNQLHNYLKYNRAVAENAEELLLPSTDCEVSKMTQMGKCSRLGSRVKVAEKCSFKRSFVGDESSVGPHCKIVDTVVMSDVTIDDNVTLTNCVVCPGAVIRSGVTLVDCIVCRGKEVGAGSQYVGETLASEEMSFSIGAESSHSDD